MGGGVVVYNDGLLVPVEEFRARMWTEMGAAYGEVEVLRQAAVWYMRREGRDSVMFNRVLLDFNKEVRRVIEGKLALTCN